MECSSQPPSRAKNFIGLTQFINSAFFGCLYPSTRRSVSYHQIISLRNISKNRAESLTNAQNKCATSNKINFSSIKSDESNQSEEYDPRSDLLAIEQINNGRSSYEDPSSTSLETLFANVFDPSLSEQVIR